MAEIILTNTDKKALCDKEDLPMLEKYEWYMDERGYAVTETQYGLIEMGQMVMLGEPPYEKN